MWDVIVSSLFTALTRKSSCVNTRCIPPVTKQVLALLFCLGGGGTPVLSWLGSTSVLSWLGSTQVLSWLGYPPGTRLPLPGTEVPPAWDRGTPQLGLGKGHGTTDQGKNLGLVPCKKDLGPEAWERIWDWCTLTPSHPHQQKGHGTRCWKRIWDQRLGAPICGHTPLKTVPSHPSDADGNDLLALNKKACKREIHPGFETQGRRHQKSKTGVSVAPQKGLMSSKNY